MSFIEVIQKGSDLVHKILKEQKGETQDSYRWITYSIIHSIASGKLVYHTLTQELIFLTDDEYEHALDNSDLRKHWFVVPASHDDYTLSGQLRTIAKMLTKKTKGIINYTIFTTTDCNARCFYCYEIGNTKRIRMTDEVALQVGKYIEDHCMGQDVYLNWFGGEPLFNQEAIDIICDDLISRNISFHSSMITNGFLFDGDMIKKAVQKWRLQKVQITLDGTEEVYNKRKSYIYKNVNGFQRVIKNIQDLLDHKIRVSIRLNLDLKNAEDLQSLLNYLHHHFSNERSLNIYCSPLYDELKNKNIDQIEDLLWKLRCINDKIVEYGLNRSIGKENINNIYRANACMADHDGSVIITSEGNLGVCEHHFQDELLGHIQSDEVDQTIRQRWKKRRGDCYPICKKCVMEPICYRLILCPIDYDCTMEIIHSFVDDIKCNMEKAYYQYLCDKEFHTERL